MIDLNENQNAEVKALADRAVSFLASQKWCTRVVGCQAAFVALGVLGVFLLRLIPNRTAVDNRLWVVVGDVPPAYLVCDKAPDWQQALAGYVEEMREWVHAVRSGSSLEGVIPVNAPRTPKYADMLESRLDFIEANFVNIPAESLSGEI